MKITVKKIIIHLFFFSDGETKTETRGRRPGSTGTRSTKPSAEGSQASQGEDFHGVLGEMFTFANFLLVLISHRIGGGHAK